MKFIKKIISSANFWPVIVVILVGIIAGKGLIGPGYFNMHDDLQMMRQLEIEKCFLSLQIPCRWVPDMGYGFGFPLFNFYPPLPYLFGEIFRIFGITFVDTVKLVFILAFVFSGITMYFLAKEFFGKFGGVISAIFYIWAPYHSVDVYVRGAMNEAWALIWFPLALLLAYKLAKNKKNDLKLIVGLSLAWAGLLLSHNLMAMIFAPVFAFWCLIWFWKYKAWKRIPAFILSGVWSIGLTAFFTLPVILEQKYTHADTLVQGYYEYSAHFATIGQLLFSRFWGYGASIWGPNDGMPFPVGQIHWVLSILIIAVVVYRFWKKRKIDELTLILVFGFLVGWFAIFMAHNKSTFIWLRIPPLRYVQFPWRFLTLAMLGLSFITGGLALLLPKKISYWVLGLVTFGLLIFNWNYFLPQHGHLGPLTDREKFSGAAWDLQQTAGIYDYLPKTAETAPKMAQKYLAEVGRGDASITNPFESTNWATFDISVPKDPALVRIGIFQFPNWKTFIDGKEVENFLDKDEKWGRMYINVPAGNHHVEVRFFDTPIRTVGNMISIVSWAVLVSFVMLQFKRGYHT